MPKANRGGRRDAIRFVNRMFLKNSNSGKTSAIDISTIKDKSLYGIENRIRGLDHEEAFIFDSKDKLLAGATGEGTSVEIPQRWESIKDGTLTHGHPTHEYDFGGTFSAADVELLAGSQLKEVRAVASGQGEFNYIAKRTSAADGNGLLSKIHADEAKLKQKMIYHFQNSYQHAKTQGKTVSQALHEAAQKATGVFDTYWEQTLPQYGFEYIKMKRGYKYDR